MVKRLTKNRKKWKSCVDKYIQESYEDLYKHPRDDIVIYVLRKEGGRALTSIEGYVDATLDELDEYTKRTKKNWLQYQ